MLVKTVKMIVATKRGRDFIHFLMTASRKIRFFSIFNIAYYFHPVDPSANPGYVTKAGRKGIAGIAAAPDREAPSRVELLVDGKVINTTYASQKVYYPVKYYGEFIGFYFPMKHLWKYIEKKQKIEICLDGILLSYRAGIFRRKNIPNYGFNAVKNNDSEKNIVELISEGKVINKFGRIQIPQNENNNWYSKVFTSFNVINECFEKKFEKELFIFYGGLLGFARSGGILSHDCDLDLAYFSEETNPDKVRQELFSIAAQLTEIYKDIIVSDNKINFKQKKVSVTPTWINGSGEFSCTFAYVGDNSTVKREDIFPIQKVEYNGYELNLPARPENIARYIYGRWWKYPDPGWKWLTEYKMHSPVFRARLTGAQVRKLNKIAARAE